MVAAEAAKEPNGEEDPPNSFLRRLIVIVVQPGEDPLIETDPPESFVPWEMVAALSRSIELVEEEEAQSKLSTEEDDDERP